MSGGAGAGGAAADPDLVAFRAAMEDQFREGELLDSVIDRGTSEADVAAAYAALAHGHPDMTSHQALMDRTGMGYHRARSAASALSDVGGFHECYDDDWDLWWVRCEPYIAGLCADRRISLLRYFRMRDELSEFQDLVVAWFVRRNRRQDQKWRLSDLKEEYVRTLQRRYFPEKPVDGPWSKHIAARYVRTAQDSIMRSFDLTYALWVLALPVMMAVMAL